MKFTRLIAITALFSISGSAKSTVLRGPNAEITLDESSRDKHMPAEDQRFLNGCDPKCTGGMEYEACKKMDQSKVGCGSCLGDHACSEAKGTIGIGSCVSTWACAFTTENIGDGSCLADGGCTFATGTIGKGSCLKAFACEQSPANIGDGSCRGDAACSYATGRIGKGSCLTDRACHATTENIGDGSCRDYYACNRATGTIGKGSCLKALACEQSPANIGDGSCLEHSSCRQSSANIGDVSCLGKDSCEHATGPIGKGSCRGGYACTEAKAMIGDGSCLEEDSCYEATANIGDGSCLGILSCYQATAMIGDGSCLALGSCIFSSGTIGNGSCLALGSCKMAKSDFIFDNSCNGEFSCDSATAIIGINSCNGKEACKGATGIIAHNKCNKDYECANRNHDDSCMAASTGFTKVDKIHGTVEIKELQHLEVGDTIKGVNENKIDVDDCEVVSVSTQGNATVFGNYTSDHYVLSADDNDTVVAHGEDGEEENVEVFQVLSSCPINVDESGKKTTFSICGDAIYDGGPMPWSVYLKIHGIMFKLVKESGVRDLSAFHDLDDAIQRLPGLCISGLTCAEEGDCGEFEAKMMDFIKHDLVTDARKKVYAAFHHLGDASKEGSISFMVSKGLSGATASE